MNLEPAAGWLVAAVSAIGNAVQLIRNWRKVNVEIERSDVEIEKLRQEIQLSALEEMRELQTAIREQAQEWLDRMRNERDEFAVQNRLLLSRVDTLEDVVEKLVQKLAEERKAWQIERQELLTKIACLEDKLAEYKRQLGVVQDATSTQPL